MATITSAVLLLVCALTFSVQGKSVQGKSVKVFGEKVAASAEWQICARGVCECSEPDLRVTCTDVPLADIYVRQYFPPGTKQAVFTNNGINHLPKEFFAMKNLIDLETLQFHGNPLVRLNGDSLRTVPKLKVLSITKSDIRRVPGDLLIGVKQLEELYIRENNQLSDIPECLLLALKNLNTVHFNYNPSLQQIPARIFSYASLLDKLVEVDLINNALTSDGIPADIFDGSPSLKIIRLWRNNLTVVKKSWFKNLSNISEIRLGHNPGLQSVESGAFDTVPSATYIGLRNGDLSEEGLPADIFEKVSPVKVKLTKNPRMTTVPSACLPEGVTCIFED